MTTRTPHRWGLPLRMAAAVLSVIAITVPLAIGLTAAVYAAGEDGWGIVVFVPGFLILCFIVTAAAFLIGHRLLGDE
jgi:hypothetical protein